MLALALLAACASADTKDSADESSFDPNGELAPSAQTLYSMSRIMVARGKDGEAEVVLAKLIADHPRYMPPYADLSELYLRNDRPDSAVEVLKAGIAVAPKDAVLLNNLGMCRLMQGRYEEALDQFTAAAAGVPKDARARANMAVALGMLGRLDESLAVYKQLMSEADAHYNLGVLCEARQDPTRAQQEYEIAEKLR
ncbi:MAG: tetratricopeptide repeat protein [Planctomycetota bacterium]